MRPSAEAGAREGKGENGQATPRLLIPVAVSHWLRKSSVREFRQRYIVPGMVLIPAAFFLVFPGCQEGYALGQKGRLALLCSCVAAKLPLTACWRAFWTSLNTLRRQMLRACRVDPSCRSLIGTDCYEVSCRLILTPRNVPLCPRMSR